MKAPLLYILCLCITTGYAQIEIYEDDRVVIGQEDNATESGFGVKMIKPSAKANGLLLRGNFSQGSAGGWHFGFNHDLKLSNAHNTVANRITLTGTATGWTIANDIVDRTSTRHHKYINRIINDSRATRSNRYVFGMYNRDYSTNFSRKYGFHNVMRAQGGTSLLYAINNELRSQNNTKDDAILGFRNNSIITGAKKTRYWGYQNKLSATGNVSEIYGANNEFTINNTVGANLTFGLRNLANITGAAQTRYYGYHNKVDANGNVSELYGANNDMTITNNVGSSTVNGFRNNIVFRGSNDSHLSGINNMLSIRGAVRYIYGAQNNIDLFYSDNIRKTVYGNSTIISDNKGNNTSAGSIYGNYLRIHTSRTTGSKVTGFSSNITANNVTGLVTGIKTVVTAPNTSNAYGVKSYCNDCTAGYFEGEIAGKFKGDLIHNGVAIYASDERFKSDIKNLNREINSMKVVKGISAKSYKMKANIGKKNRKRTYGFLAQELSQIAPDLVVEVEQEPVEEGEEHTRIIKDDTYYGVKYLEIIPILTDALKQYMSQTDARLDALGAKPIKPGTINTTSNHSDVDLSEIISRMELLESKFNQWTDCYDCDMETVEKNLTSDSDNQTKKRLQLNDHASIQLNKSLNKVIISDSRQPIAVLVYGSDNQLLLDSSSFKADHNLTINQNYQGLLRLVVFSDENDMTVKETIILSL